MSGVVWFGEGLEEGDEAVAGGALGVADVDAAGRGADGEALVEREGKGLGESKAGVEVVARAGGEDWRVGHGAVEPGGVVGGCGGGAFAWVDDDGVEFDRRAQALGDVGEAFGEGVLLELEGAEGIGPDRAELIAEWFSDPENRALVEDLRSLGLQFEVGEAERTVVGPLAGNQYVITGTLEGYTRESATAALEALGAKVSDSVSKKTTGVIVGENPGSKAAKAEKAAVPILDEAELRSLLENA